MILMIDDKEYVMKEKYRISEFKKLLAYDINTPITWRNIVGIAFDVPNEYLKYLSDDNLVLAISFISLYLSQINTEYVNKDMIDLDAMKFSDYIDLDVYFSQGLHQTLEKVIEILYGHTNDDYINEYWGGILYFISWRKQIIKSYKNLFNNEDEVEEIKNPVRKWFNTVAYLAEDDILKMNDILELPLISVFNFLAYKKEKAINDLRKSGQSN